MQAPCEALATGERSRGIRAAASPRSATLRGREDGSAEARALVARSDERKVQMPPPGAKGGARRNTKRDAHRRVLHPRSTRVSGWRRGGPERWPGSMILETSVIPSWKQGRRQQHWRRFGTPGGRSRSRTASARRGRRPRDPTACCGGVGRDHPGPGSRRSGSSLGGEQMGVNIAGVSPMSKLLPGGRVAVIDEAAARPPPAIEALHRILRACSASSRVSTSVTQSGTALRDSLDTHADRV